MCVSGGNICNFSENFAYILNDWSLKKTLCSSISHAAIREKRYRRPYYSSWIHFKLIPICVKKHCFTLRFTSRRCLVRATNKFVKTSSNNNLRSLLTRYIWEKVFKNGPNKICGRQPLKYWKGYDLLKQAIYFEYFVPYFVQGLSMLAETWNLVQWYCTMGAFEKVHQLVYRFP